jgi:hypothetical protein
VQLDSEFGSLRIEYEELSSGYRIEGLLHFEHGLIDADKTDGLREFLVAVERILGRKLEAP